MRKEECSGGRRSLLRAIVWRHNAPLSRQWRDFLIKVEVFKNATESDEWTLSRRG